MIRFFNNYDSDGAVPIRLQKFADQLAEKIVGLAGHNINIILSGDDYITSLHGDYLGDDKATDVIAFHLGDINDDLTTPIKDGIEDDVWGELYISVEQAARQASEQGHGLNRELAFLLVHGFLHLVGWTDDKNTDQVSMLAEGDRLLTEFEKEFSEFGT